MRYIKQVLGAPEHPSEVAGFRHFTTEVRVPGYHLVGKLAASGERVVYDSTVVVPEVVWQDAAAHLVFDVLDYQSRLRALFDMWGNELAEGVSFEDSCFGLAVDVLYSVPKGVLWDFLLAEVGRWPYLAGPYRSTRSGRIRGGDMFTDTVLERVHML